MADNKFKRLDAPPPPLYFNQKERDLVKQVNDELIERVIGQQVLYYPIDVERTNYHPLYGEAIEKLFLPPIRIHVLVDWNNEEVKTNHAGIDKMPAKITVHFHKRRLVEDQEVYVREGDFLAYGENFYEIVSAVNGKEIWGQTAHKIEISANCVKARRGLFDGC